MESEAEEGSPVLQVKEFSEVSRANENYCEMLKSQSLPKNVSNNTYFDIRRGTSYSFHYINFQKRLNLTKTLCYLFPDNKLVFKIPSKHRCM